MTTKYKCEKCGSIAFMIEKKESCTHCADNGYRLTDVVLRDLEMDESLCDEYQYDEELRKKASDMLGFEVLREEVETEGQCRLGDGQGAGCWKIECAWCGEFHSIIPVATCW